MLQFFGDRLIGHRLSKDLERYKVELGERTDVLKTQLAIFSHEQNVATARVDSQRAEAIHKVYACMRAIINPVTSIAAGTPIVNGTVDQSVHFYFESAEVAHEACGDLANTLSNLAIYFDNETYKEVASFADDSMDAIARYLQPLRKLHAEGGSQPQLLAVAESSRAPLRQSLNQSMQPQAGRLTAVFRLLLGVEKPHAKD